MRPSAISMDIMLTVAKYLQSISIKRTPTFSQETHEVDPNLQHAVASSHVSSDEINSRTSE